MAKQRINLYVAALKPVKQLLPLGMLLRSWLLALLLMVAAYLYLNHTHSQLQQQYQLSGLRLDAVKQQLLELEKMHNAKQPSQQLTLQLEQLSEDLNHKQFITRHLKGRKQRQDSSYSDLLLDLARLNQPQLWLTQMQFIEQQVVLRGQALTPAAVPNWLEQLQQSEFFAGQSFSLLQFNQLEQDGLTTRPQGIEFEISSLLQSPQVVTDRFVPAGQPAVPAARQPLELNIPIGQSSTEMNNGGQP